jgi:membrane protein
MARVDGPLPGPGLSLRGLPPGVVAWRIWKKIEEHEIFTRAAAVTYYALTALVPFLAVLLTVAAHLAPDLTAPSGAVSPLGGMTVDEFRDELSQLLPRPAFDVVADEIARIQKHPPFGLLSVSLVLCLWFASSVTGAVMDALNRIYGVPETRSYARLVLTSLGLTILQTVIVLATLTVLVVWPQVSTALGWRTETSVAHRVAEWVLVGFGILVSLEAMLHFGPNVRHHWRWVTPGTVAATVAFLITSLLLREYVYYFGNYGKWYGSLAGVMLLSFWVWINALILFATVLMNKIIEDNILFDRMGRDGASLGFIASRDPVGTSKP